MSIKYAILGFLSRQPLSGYDLKKMFTDSETLYWSGNNNQIYRTLVQLHQEELVSKEVEHQEDRPPRKVYSITAKGQAELRQWVLLPPELPQLKNPFLLQLMWADQLNTPELESLIASYEEELQVKVLMLRRMREQDKINLTRTPREAYLWDMIDENWILFYETQLNWLRRLRDGLSRLEGPVRD